MAVVLTMIVIAAVKEANPAMINIIREEVNDCQRALRVQGKAAAATSRTTTIAATATVVLFI